MASGDTLVRGSESRMFGYFFLVENSMLNI